MTVYEIAVAVAAAVAVILGFLALHAGVRLVRRLGRRLDRRLEATAERRVRAELSRRLTPEQRVIADQILGPAPPPGGRGKFNA